MLSWFTGAPKVTEEHAPFIGDFKTSLRNLDKNLSVVDDMYGAEGAPDTPAPQFALRALKSAFLGTPHAIQSMGKGQQQASLDDNPRKASVDAQLGCEEWRNSPPENSKRSRKNPPLSPAKGILLTPGTAAIKRKTVSFGGAARSGEKQDDIFAGQTIVGTDEERFSVNLASAGSPKENQEVQHVLSKTNFESQLQASKRRIGKRANSKDHVIGNNTETHGTPKESQESSREILPDTTIDLNVPCSRSGKHWKGEYDQYQRKSNREMRRLIQHGQTIKSYAQKKDSEVTGLHEKLNRELAKVASMEAKVSDLAIELARARSRSPPGAGESTQLMTDLAKQTATAIRSKQKAERYKAALEAHDLMRLPESKDDCVLTIDANASKHPAEQVDCVEMDALLTELSNLKLTFTAVEEKATKLESENIALKQRMARVKKEMQSYEQRRHAREERLARKQGNLLTAKEKIEAKFEQLKIEHEQLQRIHQRSVDEGGQKAALDSKSLPEECRMSAATRVRRSMLGDAINLPSLVDPMKSLEEKHAALAPESILYRPTSPLAQSSPPETRTDSFNNEKAIESRTARSPNFQESSVDIWTYDPQNGLTDDTLPSGETPTNSDFTLLRRSTYAALQEISQNSISEQQPHHQPSSPRTKPFPGSAAASAMTLHKPHFSPAALQVDSRRSTIVSPRPSFVSIASSAQKPNMQRFRSNSSYHWADHRSSILSTGTRTSTLGSRRALPLDRAEAAKKRLEAKRREKAAK